jgi:hypothetical protein
MPSNVARVNQNEYSVWIVQDKHAKAYQALLNPVAQRMGKILGIGKPEQSQKCLTCHALAVPEAEKGRVFEISEGVTCENCHGPSSEWLGNHTMKGWTHAQSVAQGMHDTKDLIRRSEKCLSCHLGTPDKWVDHEMIAAGHPDLVFELDAYSAAMPAHWKTTADSPNGAKIWGVGQAVKLRESLLRLARRADKGSWPEYSELDCFSCHHSLTKAEDSWRQASGYSKRRPGVPPYNTAHFTVFRTLARELNGDTSKKLEAELNRVYELTTSLKSDRSAVASTAQSAAGIANDLAQQLNRTSFDSAQSMRLLNAILRDADAIAAEGTRSAEQAAMSIDALYIASTKGSTEQADVRAAIKGMFQQLENPSAYSAPRFAAQMKRVAAALR